MFRESPWWAWVILFTAIILAIYVGRFTYQRLERAGNVLEERTSPNLSGIIKSLSVSISILVATILVVAGSSFIQFSPIVEEIVWSGIRFVLLVAFVWMIFGFTDLAAKLFRKKFVSDDHEYGEMAVTIVQRVFRVALSAILVLFLLENILGLHIGALITGLGIIGLALSLAGKETAENLFGAVSIFVNRPFVVGDWVKFAGSYGEIRDVRMQATHIRLLSGEMLIVPNMQFISKAVENLAMRKYLRRELDLALPYGTTPSKVEEAMEVLDEILRSDEVVEAGKCNLEDYPPQISFSDYGDYSLNLRIYYWYFIGDEGEEIQRNSERGWFSYLDHCTLVNQKILSEFGRQEIEFAFPTQTIEVSEHGQKTATNTSGGSDE